MFASILALSLAAAVPGPLQVVKNGNDEVQKVLSAPDATVDKLAKKADEFIDFVELAKRALGDQWGKLNKKQQTDFADTMKGLLRASYAQKAIADTKHGTQNVQWGAEKVEGDEATVPSTIVVGKDRFPVSYKLYRPDAKGSWRIYDVITDDVSLVETYSDQFQKLISTKGFDGLLTTLKGRRDQLEKESKKIDAAPATAAEGAKK